MSNTGLLRSLDRHGVDPERFVRWRLDSRRRAIQAEMAKLGEQLQEIDRRKAMLVELGPVLRGEAA